MLLHATLESPLDDPFQILLLGLLVYGDVFAALLQFLLDDSTQQLLVTVNLRPSVVPLPMSLSRIH